MRFPPSILEEIKARLPVSAVVGRRVRLQKAGREWKGLSPFNAEKTPSFFVNDQKGSFFDFSSGKNGDIFKFVMETEGLSFPEAVERLAAEAGVPLPTVSREAVEQEERRRNLHDVMELAAQFFEAELNGKSGHKACAYLMGRGLTPDIQRQFRLGYALPDRFALRDHLAARGVTSQTMIETGLLVSGEDIAVPYDRFRDRVMFPIGDAKGRIVAFGGRALSADVSAKYLNSPETPLFHKGRLLYNQHDARKAAHDRGTIVAVEGYVDVIAMSAAGFPHTVAPLGTALTEDQLGLLWRMADEPILCFDGDKAGRRAAYRAIDVALPALQPGKSLRFALLPEGQDPDDLARSGGAAAIESVLSAARPLVDLLWAREVEAGPLDTPERRAALERRFGDVLRDIKDEVLRRHYRAEIDGRLAGVMPDAGRNRPMNRGYGSRGGAGSQRYLGSRPPMRASPALAGHPLFAASSRESPREALIVLALVHQPRLLAEHAETLVELDFSGRDARLLAGRLVDCVAERQQSVVAAIAAAGLGPVVERLKALVRPGDRWALEPDASARDIGDTIRQAMTLHRRAHSLHTQLRAAERALAENESEGNLAWLLDVRARISSLDGAEADLEGFGGVGRDNGI